jgi:oligopeptide/dipeptide ABC transporter ATP-binding protein
MSDRIAVMYLGQIVELAGNSEIYEHPFHPYTCMLLSALPGCDPVGKRTIAAIKGEAGAENDRGCNFQNRCPYKVAICSEQEPVLKQIEDERFCACHLTGSI